MNFDSAPAFLPSLKPLGKITKAGAKNNLEKELLKDPRKKEFWSKLPNASPYRIMLCKLPPQVATADIQAVLDKHNVNGGKLQHKVGQRYCFLHFNDKRSCLQTVDLMGEQISGSQIIIKVSNAEQQREIRTANTGTSSRLSKFGKPIGPGGSSRFVNLRKGDGPREPIKKHRAPVTGSIRKKRTQMRTNQSIHSQNKQPKGNSNPWNQSDSKHQEPVRAQINHRGQPNRVGGHVVAPGGRFGSRATAHSSSSRDSESRGGMNFRNNAPRRNEQPPRDRGADSRNRRMDDDRGVDFRNRRMDDDRGGDFRNRRMDDDRGRARGDREISKRRDDPEGRADTDTNWRKGMGRIPRKSPRDSIPAFDGSSKPRFLSRADPTRSDNSGGERRPTGLRRGGSSSASKKDAEALTRKPANSFAMLGDDE